MDNQKKMYGTKQDLILKNLYDLIVRISTIEERIKDFQKTEIGTPLLPPTLVKSQTTQEHPENVFSAIETVTDNLRSSIDHLLSTVVELENSINPRNTPSNKT
jgi:hypothetical protein